MVPTKAQFSGVLSTPAAAEINEGCASLEKVLCGAKCFEKSNLRCSPKKAYN